MDNNLMVLEVEAGQIQLRLKEKIRSIRYTLDNLESKLNNNEKLYESDGLQGNTTDIDVYLAKLVSYERAIKLLGND